MNFCFRLLVVCTLILTPTIVSAQWTAYNDCARPGDEEDLTAENVTSYSIYNGYTDNTSGQLVDFITGDQLDVNVEFRFDPDLGIMKSSNSGANPTGGDAYEIFHLDTGNPDDWKVDFSDEIIYYGIVDEEKKWWTEIHFSGLNPQKTYTFAGTAIRGEDYPNRHSLITISGHSSASNNSSEATTKTPNTTIFNAGDNSVTNFVVRWDNIMVSDDGSGTGSFVIRAEATDDSEEGKAYPLNGFMLQAHESVEACPDGDITGDCIVNVDDLVELASQWMAGIAGSADINGDGSTDLLDFAILSNDWMLNWQKGSLQVNIEPTQAAAAGAQWRISGGNWKLSNDVLAGLPVGDYTVEFKTVADWDQPKDQVVSVEYNKNTVLPSQYERHNGSVRIAITPSQAVTGGAKWSIDNGTTWHDSGDTVNSTKTGSHTVEFNNISGWAKPSPIPITVEKDQTYTGQASYTRHTGSIQVIIEPAAAVAAGARWSIDNGTTWNDSGQVVSNISTGTVSVQFKDVNNWATPAAQEVEVQLSQTTPVTSIYSQHTGSLQVTITPAAAATAGAKWSIDNGSTWNNSGSTLNDLPTGQYTVQFNSISGWTNPGYVQIDVIGNQTVSASKSYTQQTGSLIITISPSSAVSEGAMWRVDSGSWQASGDLVENLSTGDHIVSYSEIDNWTTPDDQIVSILQNQTVNHNSSYILHTGSVTVDIDPAQAVTEGAQWKLDDEIVWRDSGVAINGVRVGNHTIHYKGISDWDTPVSEGFTLTDGQAFGTQGFYAHHTGSVSVTITPAQAVTVGAKWSIDNGVTWNESGATISGIETGDYTVTYITNTGWESPADQLITVSNNLTSSASGSYARQYGSLTVNILPSEAASTGAQWSIDGTEWYSSGATIDPLAVDTYTIQFNNISGWTKPGNKTVSISDGITSSESGTYTQLTGSLRVTLAPAGAVAAGGQWAVDSGEWHNSGDTVSDLAVGSHTVTYKTVSGYNIPSADTVDITDSQLTVHSAEYILQTGSITVTINPEEAVTAGARWSIDNGSTWHNSGNIIAEIDTDDYTITFNTVSGWNKPDDQNITISNGITASATGDYIRQTGSVSASISPAEVVTAGAQWSIDSGTTWNNSGSILNDLPSGSYTVQYNSVSGWNAPADEVIAVTYNQTESASGVYSRKTGSLKVTITPALAVSEGVQWKISGGTWRNSSYTETDLPIGDYTVEYRDIEGWTTPADETVTVNDNLTTNESAAYVERLGSIQVNLSPAASVSAGAQWSIDNGTTWKDNGDTVSQLRIGSHIVVYSAISDWHKPADETVTILENQTEILNRTYVRDSGSLTVTIDPADARQDGAQWSVDGTNYYNSGYTLTGLETGSYSVQFNAVVDWNSPDSIEVDIEKDITASTTGTYVRQTGSLTVSIAPAQAVTDGAQWSIDSGSTWNNSDAVISGLNTGDYTVTYKSVSGWNKPADELVTVQYNLTGSKSGTYVRQTGSLNITISPASAVSAGAQWSIDSGTTWNNSGTVVSGLDTGDYTVTYKTISGWNEPAEEDVAVNYNQTTSESGSYLQNVGSLHITIEPSEAVAAGAQWSIDNGQNWHDNLEVVNDLPVGDYLVQYRSITGWTEPTDETVTVLENQTITESGTYIRQTGSLSVTISPAEAVSAGAQWSIDSGTTWNNSDMVVSVLETGDFTVTYKAVSGWDEPADVTVAVNYNQTTNESGTYTQKTGSLTVDLYPQQAIDEGALWRITGESTWRTSSDTVTGLPIGSCTIEFDSISQWHTPDDITTTVTDGQGTSETGNYILMAGALTVDIEPQQAIDAGAQWTIDGGTTWNSGGEIITDLRIGSYTIEFSTIDACDRPDDISVTILDNQNIMESGTYSAHTGSIEVTILPGQAVSANAQWSIDEGATWNNSAAAVDNLPVGLHTVIYKNLAGWTTPIDHPVVINKDITSIVEGTYVISGYAPLIISEFMADNDSDLPLDNGEILDEDGDDSDWIEIYNPTDSAVSMNNWILVDASNQWVFPDVSLDAGMFMIVFASGKDRRNPASELHTNFGLGKSGEYLALIGPDGNTIVHEYMPDYPEQLSNVSYGVSQYSEVIINEGADIKYIVPASSDASTNWTTQQYSDTDWDDGQIGIGFGGLADEGLVAYYSMNEGSGSVANDTVGGHHGSLEGNVMWTDGPLGGSLGTALDFAGNVGDFLNCGNFNPSEATGQLSISHWIYWRGSGDSWQGSIAKRDTWSPDDMMWQVEVANSSSTLVFKRNGDSPSFSFSMPVEKWTHVAVTFDGTTATLYRDGTLIGSDEFSFGFDPDSALTIGAGEAYGENPWNGKVDEVRLYDRALDIDEVQTLAGGGNVTTSLESQMKGTNSSVWIRIPFQVEDVSILDAMLLSMKYEDGFVAYINGHEVARRNASGSVQWNSYDASSLADRQDENSEEYESIVITDALGYVQSEPAWNVLAIQGLNDNVNNNEFLMLPKLTVASNQSRNRYFTFPTPGDFNHEGYDDRVGDTSFNFDRGFYTTPFNLSVTCGTSDAQIRYTLDGSEPSWTNGTDYTGPIYIDSTATVRAVALKPGYIDSNVDTQTYIFVQDVVNQSPGGATPTADWPVGPVNGQILDYGMDPDIVTNPAYNVEQALLDIPTMSLVTDLNNLFNPSTDPSIGGIYVNASLSREDGRAWEKPASLELINPDGSKGFQVNCGLRIRGGYSRSDNNPKHAFRFFFRDQYGQSKLEYPLFGNEGVDKFDKIDLRCSQNYSWAFSGSDNNTMLREVFSRDQQGAMDQPYTRSRYYHLYVNGQYWGLFQTQERAEANYAESYFGGNDDEYDVIKIDRTEDRNIKSTDGNLEAYLRLWTAAMAGFTSDEDYMRVQGYNLDGTRNPAYERLLDAENLIDHMIINYYTGDRDGPGSRYGNKPNNMYGIYNRENPDGWKWFEHDSEHSFGVPGDNENMVSPFTTAGTDPEHFGSQWLHEQLANQNPEYRLWFADRVHKHFYNSGVLSVGMAEQYISNRAGQIDLAIIAESARWGDSKVNPPRTYETWIGAVDEVYNWMSDRVDRMIVQFRDVGWFPSIDAPSFNQHSGYVSSGFDVTMTNPNGDGTIFYTVDGSDPRLPVRDSSPGTSVTLLSESASKKYSVPSGEVETSIGTILGQYWFDISGADVSDLTSQANYPDSPDETMNHTTAEIYVNQYETYGVRFTGFLHPPDTGNYTFWISSDDAGQLWLSTDENPANAAQIAYVGSWTSSRQWDKLTSQESASISLQAGQKYYIEALMKEQGGGDNLAIGWRGPSVGSTAIEVIDGAYLSSRINWYASDFDDTGWSTGSGAIGYEAKPNDAVNYENLIDIDVKTAMLNNNATCYIRAPFNVTNTELESMSMNVRYDDGFIAYLNGTEIQRVNFDAGLTPAYDSSANASHGDSLAINLVNFDISEHIGLLKSGENILAIQALNVATDSSDFLCSAEITAFEKSQGDVSPNANTYVSAETLNKSTQVKSRVFNGVWSALNEAVFAVGSFESLRITEIMYHPEDPNHEYIELKNVGPDPINLNLAYFKDGIDFTFGDYDLGSGQHVLVVRNQAAFEQKYGTGLPVAGQYDGALDNSGEKIRLRDPLGSKIQTFDYKDSWYPLTDGPGFSLTILDPSSSDPNDWDEKEGWRASTYTGGSPGTADADIGPAPESIQFNEFLAHSHSTAPDWIELKNTTDQDIDISGWFISDDFDLADTSLVMKYEFPADTVVPGNGYLVIYEDAAFGNPAADGCHIPFGLSEAGETLYLHSGSGGELTGSYITEQDFDASHTGVTIGRYEKASLSNGYDFVALDTPTPASANSGPWTGPIVITEIMYNPANSGGEYIEIRNTSGSSVTLMDSVTTETAPGVFITESKPWVLQNAIDFAFPHNTTIGPGEYLIIARNRDDFLAEPAYTSVPSSKVLGPYDGKLSNEGEKVELAMPGDQEYGQARYYIPRDEVKYNNTSPWPVNADGLGDSLHRIDDYAYANDYLNWSTAEAGPNN